MSDIHRFRLPVAEFDTTLLPEQARIPGSPSFREAVHSYLEDQFSSFGGWRSITVTSRDIEVAWTPSGAPPDPLEQMLDKLRSGDYRGGITLLKFLLSDRPGDTTVLFNLGMALSDVGELPEAERHLRQALRNEPDAPYILIALGVALLRGEKVDEAIEVLERAQRAAPQDLWALRNLAAAYGKSERYDDAASTFRRATELHPQDQSAWLGLAEALKHIGHRDEATDALNRVLTIDEHSPAADAARNKLNEHTFQDFRDGGPERLDAVMYCIGALERFSQMPKEQIGQVGSEIGLLGMKGIKVNDPSVKYRLTTIPGEFSGLQLMALMYVAFQILDPKLDIGFDLAKEYRTAKQMFGGDKPSVH